MKKKISIITIVFLLFSMNLNNLFTNVFSYDSQISVTGATIAFDIYHGGYHTTPADLAPIIGNLTAAGNSVLLINNTWELPDEVDALFLTQCDDDFTAAEKADVKAWFELSDKLLVVSGDSDYGGYFDADPINDLLEYIGTILRLDTTSIADIVYNDDADYRVAAINYGSSPTANNISDGCDAGIMMHGPCAVLGYNGTNYVDLRSTSFSNVEILVSYSENATSSDSDVSDNLALPDGETTDRYSRDNQTTYEHGNYPAVVYEKFNLPDSKKSYLIVAGEAIYTYYHYMYNQKTESGYYNGGTHYGQKFVDNIINNFVGTDIDPSSIIAIFDDEDFLTYGFPGAGTQTDPYIIENYSYQLNGLFGIYIGNTTKYAIIRNCEFSNGLSGITIEEAAIGTIQIQKNTFRENEIGIVIIKSSGVMVQQNTHQEELTAGISLTFSDHCVFSYNEYRDCLRFAVFFDDNSDFNLIHHNNFINNSFTGSYQQALDDGNNNIWYQQSSKEGNYWSDLGTETEYRIEGSAHSYDLYPLSFPVNIENMPTPTMKITYSTFAVLLSMFGLVMVLKKKSRKR